MFIGAKAPSQLIAPEERNVVPHTFRPNGARKIILHHLVYKHLAPNGAKNKNVLLLLLSLSDIHKPDGSLRVARSRQGDR